MDLFHILTFVVAFIIGWHLPKLWRKPKSPSGLLYDESDIKRARHRINRIRSETNKLLRRSDGSSRNGATTYIVVTKNELLQIWSIADDLLWDI
ncbi:MAG: hypothetical protein LPK02_07550 [Rhodobacterales bacterium]|nr:hypothetical protein [Rhodobacterales bacterium]